MSLAIYDAKGRMIRTLQNAKPLAAGPHALVWDGLDQYGAPQPAGSYTWKALGSPGLEATFLGMVGIDLPP
jgi:flagellar hook assembly protein FlgD